MALDRFVMGSVVKLTVNFKTPKTATPANTLVDPATVTIAIRRPDKTTVNKTYGVDDITKVSTGVYQYLVTLDQEGTYYWKWSGSNGSESAGVQTGVFDSMRSPNF